MKRHAGSRAGIDGKSDQQIQKCREDEGDKRGLQHRFDIRENISFGQFADKIRTR